MLYTQSHNHINKALLSACHKYQWISTTHICCWQPILNHNQPRASSQHRYTYIYVLTYTYYQISVLDTNLVWTPAESRQSNLYNRSTFILIFIYFIYASTKWRKYRVNFCTYWEATLHLKTRKIITNIMFVIIFLVFLRGYHIHA